MSVLTRASRTIAALAMAATVAVTGAALPAAPAHAIVDGRNVSPGVLSSSLVRLHIGDMSCTGTLITPEWVLTARHCIAEGATGGVTSIGPRADGEKRSVVETRPHPTADLAVVKLSAPSGAGTANLSGEHQQSGARALVTGWGGSHTYKQFLGQQADAQVERRVVNLPSPDRSAVLLESIIYHGRLLPGDSGGALWVNGQVVGVLSMSTATSVASQDGTMGWFIPVAEHLEWISRVTGKPVPAAGGTASPLIDATAHPSRIPMALIQNIPATGSSLIDSSLRSAALGSS